MNDSILIIDDEVDFLDSVRRGLLSAGLKNLRLESDPRVVATAIQNGEHFDMALIDITMPWINGIQLLEMIKTNSPRRNASWSQPSTRPGSLWSASRRGPTII